MNNKIQDRLFIKDLGDNYVLHRIKDGILTIEGDSHHVIHGIQPFYKLSVKNCEAIKLGYDLDELAELSLRRIDGEPVNDFFQQIFKLGFRKALEILGDKKFRESDIKAAIRRGYVERQVHEGVEVYFETYEEFIQSLQQNEWEVEIEMEPYHDGNFVEGGKTHSFEPKWRPKLDVNGCLILKKII